VLDGGVRHGLTTSAYWASSPASSPRSRRRSARSTRRAPPQVLPASSCSQAEAWTRWCLSGVPRFQNCFQRRASCTICKMPVPRNPPFPAGFSVERTGIEPVTSGLQILCGDAPSVPMVSVRR
jgi:hypothetical protein